MISRKAGIHQWIFVSLMILTVIGMQFSHFLVSISIILMAANFLIEGDFSRKWKFCVDHKVILFFCALFLLHVLGLLWTTDVDYAMRDIQIKLPLLALALVIGSSAKISRLQFELILLFFLATSLLSSIIGSLIYFVWSQPGDDYRLMSPFMSHIRLSLMMGVAMFSAFYLGRNSHYFKNVRPFFIGLGVWFLGYLFMLRAMSGIMAVLAAIFVLLWIISSEKNIKYTKTLKLSIIGFVLLGAIYVGWQVRDFYAIEKIPESEFAAQTDSGAPYYFDVSIPLFENGRYVFSYIAKSELHNAWNEVSEIPCDSLDRNGQQLESTLVRYMTSKGLRKDREGVAQLTHLDIWAIENGIANYRFLNGKSLNTMVYRYIWEVHNFMNGFNPQGNSLGQRFLFWKLGSEIFIENFWMGVGTGDVQLAYNEKYDNLPFHIQEKYRLRAHNQYLTMGITFGIFGLLFFIVTMIYGFAEKPNTLSYLFTGFFVIYMVSMLDEDTLETQFGVTFAVFFYFFLLFQHPPKEDEVTEKL
jgi:O-antigen ligase